LTMHLSLIGDFKNRDQRWLVSIFGLA